MAEENPEGKRIFLVLRRRLPLFFAGQEEVDSLEPHRVRPATAPSIGIR